MDFNDNNDENNSANNININPSSMNIGLESNLENNNSDKDIPKQKDASIQMDNNNFQNEEENKGYEEEIKYMQKEEEEEDEEEEEEEAEEEENNYKNNLVPMENFSQQVDFLFHPNDPEWQTRIKPQKAKVTKKKKNLKNNKSKSKNKSKNKNKNKNVKKKQKMKIINKIRPEFNLCTKIDPQPKTQSIFYSRQIDETRVEKQRRARAEKIAEYEENYARQKEIYKAKRKKEEEDLKNNYIKSRTSNNFYQNKANPNNMEFLNQIKSLSKIDYPETDIRKYECNPQKYDGIIHSLLKEISQIKLQRERENEEFVNKIKKLQNDVDKNKNRKKSVKNRPKSGNKVKINNKKSNNVLNIIKNYHKQYKPRPKTGNKLKSNNSNNNINKKENEIPIDNISNVSKSNTKNNFYQAEKENILKNIQDLEMQKNIKINELMNQREKNEERNDYFNNVNEYNNNNFENYKNNINEISNYPNKNISKSENLNQHVMNLNNNIVYNPIQFNIMNNINPNDLNYQDKIQALNELNNNIGKFTSSIPKLVNKVNETLNKIYGNTDNPIKNAINKHPLVIVTSKATHKMIKSNIDDIMERLIEDLLLDCVNDLNAIDNEIKRREKRKNLLENFQKTFKNLNFICNNEEYIGNEYNLISNGGRNNII